MPKNASGLTDAGVTALINAAEYKDIGTSRYPWSGGFKATALAAIKDLKTPAAMKAELNRLVVSTLGGGIAGRGPIRK